MTRSLQDIRTGGGFPPSELSLTKKGRRCGGGAPLPNYPDWRGLGMQCLRRDPGAPRPRGPAPDVVANRDARRHVARRRRAPAGPGAALAARTHIHRLHLTNNLAYIQLDTCHVGTATHTHTHTHGMGTRRRPYRPSVERCWHDIPRECRDRVGP